MPRRKLKNWAEATQVDYFSHYSGLWTSFNAWYNAEFNLSNDRASINHIKSLSNSDPLVDAFKKICRRKDENLTPLFNFILKVPNLETNRLHGYAVYTVTNVVTRFIKSAWTNPVVKTNLWFGEQTNRPSGARSASIATKYVDKGTYIEGYSKLARFEASPAGGTHSARSLQSVLEEFGFSALGCCFYVDPNAQINGRISPHAGALQGFVNNEFDGLIRARDVQNPDYKPKGLFADVVEMLYVVRNACVHGEFDDPRDPENAELFQSAYECLHTLIAEFLGESPSQLHP